MNEMLSMSEMLSTVQTECIITHKLKGHVSMVIKNILCKSLIYLECIGNWCS